ncbi:unnamed protein product [Protopolystoma xenopodis]|uniref:Uncharacterized protein n=1 Tax=Protopolystoma xenopodis TaxID=117903 RepID=A0A3S5AKG8_9PLAT|nr:unnamed protein product [Protopolystoma xenopodis]
MTPASTGFGGKWTATTNSSPPRPASMASALMAAQIAGLGHQLSPVSVYSPGCIIRCFAWTCERSPFRAKQQMYRLKPEQMQHNRAAPNRECVVNWCHVDYFCVSRSL